MAGIQANKRTVTAIQKADLLPNTTGIKRVGLLSYSQINTYTGMFAVINTSDETAQKIKIVDGLDNTAVNCGYIQVNKLTSQDVPTAELTITADAYIYRQVAAVLDTSTPPVMTSATVTFEQSATRPEWEANKEKKLLAVVKYASGAITNIIEYRISEKVDIKGEC